MPTLIEINNMKISQILNSRMSELDVKEKYLNAKESKLVRLENSLIKRRILIRV